MQLACGEMCFFFTSSLRMLLECCCSSWQEEETSRRLLLLVNFQESWRKIHSSVFCHFIQEDPSLSVRKLGIPLEPPTPTREEIRPGLWEIVSGGSGTETCLDQDPVKNPPPSQDRPSKMMPHSSYSQHFWSWLSLNTNTQII